jgi:DNA polymerase III epsilon subunit-like protein
MANCNRCNQTISWRQGDGGAWVPTNPTTGKDHRPDCGSNKPAALIVVDTETTGLEAGHHELVQVAAVALDPTTLVEIGHWASHIAPLHPERASAKAMATNGLDLAWLATQPDTDTARRGLTTWLAQYRAKPIPVGYNVGFDLDHLDAWPLVNVWSHRRIDVLQLTTTLLWRPGHVTDAKLPTITARLGIPHAAHDALADARATAEVLRRICSVWDRGLTAIA